MKINEKDIILKPLEDEDIILFENWMDKDFIKKWFGEKKDWLEEIYSRKDVNNPVPVIHFILYHKKKKIGFCQYIDGYFLRELYTDPIIIEKNYGYEVNYFIGEEEYLNKGIGKIMIKKLEEKIKEIGGKELLADPVPENELSQKLLLSCGFIKIKDGDYRKKIE